MRIEIIQGTGGKHRRRASVVIEIDVGGDAPMPPRLGRSVGRALPAPGGASGIEVTAAMREAAKAVFLSRDRVEGLSDTLAEIYRAMEGARRRGS